MPQPMLINPEAATSSEQLSLVLIQLPMFPRLPQRNFRDETVGSMTLVAISHNCCLRSVAACRVAARR